MGAEFELLILPMRFAFISDWLAFEMTFDEFKDMPVDQDLTRAPWSDAAHPQPIADSVELLARVSGARFGGAHSGLDAC